MKNTKHNKKHMKKANKLGIKSHESEKKKNFIYKLALISLPLWDPFSCLS